jgi:hypothetical protein
MDNGLILMVSFSYCILLTLCYACIRTYLIICCACIRTYKQREREIQEKINLKKLLKRKKIIKPILGSGENFSEEVKDEKENNFRTPD